MPGCRKCWQSEHRRWLLGLLCMALCACQSVRTVYDENGQEVKDEPHGGEKDLMSHFESQFNASFSESRTKDGVPQATSTKRSRFQKDIDEARRGGTEYVTGAFGGVNRQDSLRSVSFDGANKEFTGGKSYNGLKTSPISRDLRPDFMNESHGISHSDSYMDHSQRSSADGVAAVANGRTHAYSTEAEAYQTNQQSGYFESRRNRTPEPRIMDYRDYYRKTIEETRTMLGRDAEE